MISKSICISCMGADHLGITLEQFLSVCNIAPISLRFLEDNKCARFVIYIDTLRVLGMQFLNQSLLAV